MNYAFEPKSRGIGQDTKNLLDKLPPSLRRKLAK